MNTNYHSGFTRPGNWSPPTQAEIDAQAAAELTRHLTCRCKLVFVSGRDMERHYRENKQGERHCMSEGEMCASGWKHMAAGWKAPRK